jgi:formate hydrogenlyase subunit 3/multisubunit Na+/H+ antiporter MnhD subunit
VTLVLYLVITIGACTIALLGRTRHGVATTVGLIGLVLAVISAFAIDPTTTIEIGGSVLAASAYARLFLILGSLVGLALALVGLAAGSRRDTPAVTLGTLGAIALALSLPDPRIAILASTAGGLVGVLLTLVPGSGRAGATVGIRVLRALVVAGAMAVAAAAWIGRDLSELAAQPVVFGLAYLAFGLAVAIRFGAIPFHVWAARLTDSVPESALPIITAWGPAAFAVVALAWTDSSVAPLPVDMDAERAVLLAIAVATIVLAAFAALIQDDLEHVVGYSIIGDAGVVLLAIVALTPEVWAPARTWILSYVVARSAFAAWAAAIRATFFTGRIADMGGWVLRAPLLGVAFVAVVVASIGLPGLAAFDARTQLVDIALDSPLQGLVFLATFLPLLYYGRLAAIGVVRPDPALGGGTGFAGLPTKTPLDLTDARTSASTFWNANRAPSAVLVAILVSVLALAVSAGGFGGPTAAAGLPPGGGEPGEDFEPGQSGLPEGSFPVDESVPPEESAPVDESTTPDEESPAPDGSEPAESAPASESATPDAGSAAPSGSVSP